MKRNHEEKEPNHERWLLTYSDLITLLMIFFIIMYASSNIDAGKYKKLSESFKVAMGGGKTLIAKEDGESVETSTKPIDTETVEQKQEDSTAEENKAEENKLEEVKQNVDKYLKENGLQANVTTTVQERGLVISLQDTLIFDSARADIKLESKIKLIEIGKILNRIDNYIRIEGHTDNVPISNYRFNSNWQLSVIRATNVTELLIQAAGVLPQRLSSIGYGEYRPVADNATEAGRSKNRRVDIIVLNSKFNQVENNKKD